MNTSGILHRTIDLDSELALDREDFKNSKDLSSCIKEYVCYFDSHNLVVFLVLIPLNKINHVYI